MDVMRMHGFGHFSERTNRVHVRVHGVSSVVRAKRYLVDSDFADVVVVIAKSTEIVCETKLN